MFPVKTVNPETPEFLQSQTRNSDQILKISLKLNSSNKIWV